MKKAGFGTDGWRGVIAEDFTFENLRLVTQAIVSYIRWRGMSGSVVVGYDTRFMSDMYADTVARIVAGNGLTALLSECAVTTPMLSHAAKTADGCGGIMVTASHNPCKYNGLKYKAAFGGSAYPAMTREIEYLIGKEPVRCSGTGLDDCVNIIKSDFYAPYRDCLNSLVDKQTLSSGGFRVVLDCMHGAAGGFAGRLFGDMGLEPYTIRTSRDPYFGGADPEPNERNLKPLSAAVIEGGYDAGFAVDGDADRLGVMDSGGHFVTAHQILSLILLHMHKNRGETGLVIKTVSTSSIVDRVASSLGLPVVETPVGFKHICELMLKEDVLAGGEENGGIGIKGFIPERDGLLTALMLVEMMSREDRTVGELVKRLDDTYGRLYYRRHDRIVGEHGPELFGRLKEVIRNAFGDFGISRVGELDGVKAVFEDGSWVLFRLSGTEPLIRVYAEADDEGRVDRLITRAMEALDG